MTTVAIGAALAARPNNGGGAWVRFSYALGFKRLGYDVKLVEDAATASHEGIEYARALAGRYDVQYATAREDDGADVLVNISGNIRGTDVLSRYPRRIYVDLDPGFTQFWHQQGLLDLAEHDVYFTIGNNIGRHDCPIPTNGIAWRHTRPPVVLDEWPVVDAEFSRFTTVANWRAPFGPIEPYGLKHHEWRKVLALPRETGLPFEAALAIDGDDSADRAALEEHGWTLTDPAVAATPDGFRSYVQGSGAEFSVAQGVYVGTRSGWFSDRTVRYLASGRPALVQDTCSWIPAGEGLLTFSSLEEAVAGARAIRDDYERHARAARVLAEEFFDSDRVLPALLEDVPSRPLRPVGRVHSHAVEDTGSFTFAVTGETRPPVPGMGYTQITRRIFGELALIRPAFVLFTGDAIWGYDDSVPELREEIEAFRQLADSSGVAVYNSLGNHEMQSRRDAIATLTDAGWDLYGSFDVGGWHFVCLNTDEWWRERRVCGDQLDWLRRDLAARDDRAGSFVFMHRSLFSWFSDDFDPNDSAELQHLFRTHGVRAVFSSHDHMFGLEERDGVRYYTTGGGGAPLYAQPDKGGFAHYLLVTVNGDDVDYNVVEPFHVEHDVLDGGARVRLVNTTDRDLVLRNVELTGPRRAAYELATDFLDFARRALPVRTRVLDVREEDERAFIRAEVEVPTGTGFLVTLAP